MDGFAIRTDTASGSSAQGRLGKDNAWFGRSTTKPSVVLDLQTDWMRTRPHFEVIEQALRATIHAWSSASYLHQPNALSSLGLWEELPPTSSVNSRESWLKEILSAWTKLSQPAPKEEVLDWDASLGTPPGRSTTTIHATLKYVGRSRPIPVTDPWAE